MKKRLKGLIALIMAMTMVLSVAPNTYGAISDEVYSTKGDECDYVLVYNYIGQSPYYTGIRDSWGSNIKVNTPIKTYFDGVDSYGDSYGLYTDVVGWKIWGRTQDGGYDLNNTKEVDFDYVITVEDIKNFGCIGMKVDEDNESAGEVETYFPPVISPLYVSKEFDIDVYNVQGNVEKTITVDVNSMDETLEIPEGYIGYILYSNYVDSGWGSGFGEEQIVFVADYDDIWTEIEIMSCFNYTPVKLVPTKTMPYFFGTPYEGNIFEKDFMEQTVFLVPGQKIISNSEVQEYLSDYDYDEEIEWNVWGINYCGSTYCYDNLSNDDQGDYIEYGTKTALSVEDYTEGRKDIYTFGSADTFYYKINYPVLWSNEGVGLKTYVIPYYDFDGNHNSDDDYIVIDKGSVSYESGGTTYYQKIQIWSDDGKYDNCRWYFEYDGVEYGPVNYYKDIWDIAIANGNYDPTKAKLIAACSGEHEFDFTNGKVVSNPTVSEKGSTEYRCKNCSITTTRKDIDKLIAIESVTLSNTEYTYNGTEFKPSVTAKAYVDSKLVTLTKDVDYNVSYSNNKNVGTATVTVTGKGKFAGTKTATFKIKAPVQEKIKISTVDFTVKPYYTGKAIKGKLVVKARNGKKLTEGKDYTVTYKNNIKIGTASVVVTGKGNYTGSLTTKFKIIPAKVSGLKQTKYKTNSISLKWNKVEGATGYIVYLENVKTGELKSIGKAKTTGGTAKNLKPGKEYRLVVKAYTIVDGKKVYGNASDARTMITKTTVAKINVTSNAKRRATITWNKVTGADGYEVYMSSKKTSGYKKIAVVSKNTAKFTKASLTSKKTYYFKARSYKKNESGTKVYSEFSSVKSVKVK